VRQITKKAAAHNHALGQADRIVQDFRVHLRNGGLITFNSGDWSGYREAHLRISRLRSLTTAERKRYFGALSDAIFDKERLPLANVATSIEAANRKTRLRLN